MNRFVAGVVATLLLVPVAACSSSPSTDTDPSAGSTTAADLRSQAEPQVSTPRTAEEVTTALAAKIPSLKLTKVFSAEDDPNKQLGRPNGYTSKSAFTDTRIAVEGAVAITKENDTLRGGGVEVFPDEAGAKARMEYIQQFGKQTPMLAEYDYVVGGVLLRVSKELTPTQAKEYETALSDVLG
ncbi:hypothetical protein [Lentzea sp. NPDC003310]|uniref:hypothetical protein n=1 Tax=Lentzea sp. NPDC003310 TaxID=3154447 RepID=UPI0033A14E04